MSKESVRNLVLNKFDLAQCSTASLSAILHTEPEDLTLKALYGNTFSLREIAALTTYELLKQGIGIFVRVMDNDIEPSNFFRSTAHPLKHGKKLGVFIGGYMITKCSHDVEHLVGITSFHEGRRPKVTVCNTTPYGTRRKIIMLEPLEWLDRNVHPNDGKYEERAIAIVGTRLNLDNQLVRDQIEQLQHGLRNFRNDMLRRKYKSFLPLKLGTY